MVVAVLLLQGACAKTYYGSLAEPLSSDARRMSAVGVRAVKLTSRQGPIAFVATPGDTIAISMRVGHARGAMGTTRDCDQGSRPPTISARVEGNALHLESARALPDECVTEWTVALPASIAIEADVTAGRVSVQGMAGGVSLDIKTGDAEASVADGPVDIRTNVGDVKLDYQGNAYGSVRGDSRVGTVELRIGDRAFAHRKAPGSGDSIRLEGPSSNAISLSANVGKVAITLRSVSDSR